MNENLFRKESLDKVKNPEQTDEYLKVTNPSFWLIVLAAVILAVSFAYWGFVGTIPNRTAAIGVVENGKVTVFMSAENVMAIGDSLEVLIDGVSHQVTDVKSELFSASQIKEIYGESLNPAEMNFVIMADATGVSDGIKSLSVVTNRIRAIDYMLQQGETSNE